MTNEEFLQKVKKAISYDYVEADFYKVAEDYDVKNNNLDGHRNKEFLRIDSSLFKDLTDELQTNPNCGYITYANNILKEGYIPKKLSCLIKRLEPDTKNELKVDDPDLTFKEAMASQILNLYECPTAFNITVKDSEINEDYAFSSLSVDMVSDDILTLENLGCELTNNLEKNLTVIGNQLVARGTQRGIPYDLIKEYSMKIIEDYTYSFLIRKFILQDGDFFECNGGILVEENKLQYVNFDFEHIFFDYYAWPNITKTLTLTKNNFPHIYEKFVKKSRLLYDSLNDLTNNKDMEWVNDDQMSHVNIMQMNLRTALLACKRIENISTQ